LVNFCAIFQYTIIMESGNRNKASPISNQSQETSPINVGQGQVICVHFF